MLKYFILYLLALAGLIFAGSIVVRGDGGRRLYPVINNFYSEYLYLVYMINYYCYFIFYSIPIQFNYAPRSNLNLIYKFDLYTT